MPWPYSSLSSLCGLFLLSLYSAGYTRAPTKVPLSRYDDALDRGLQNLGPLAFLAFPQSKVP